MTSKRGKRKKYGTRGGTECVAHVPTTFFNMYDLSTDPRQQGIFLFYARKKKHNPVNGDIIHVSVL